MNHDYDGVARFYDRVAGWPLAPVRRELARQAAMGGAGRVLDIGCGTGLQLLDLRKLGLRAVGADSSAAMLNIARRRLPGAERAGLIQASGADLPFADDGFDLALFSLVLHESRDDPRRLLGEALRVAPRVWALDWGLAERNLDYPARLPVWLVERLAGRRHFAAYREYMARGALEGLIERYRRQGGVRVAGRSRLFFNTMLLLRLERE